MSKAQTPASEGGCGSEVVSFNGSPVLKLLEDFRKVATVRNTDYRLVNWTVYLLLVQRAQSSNKFLMITIFLDMDRFCTLNFFKLISLDCVLPSMLPANSSAHGT